MKIHTQLPFTANSTKPTSEFYFLQDSPEDFSLNDDELVKLVAYGVQLSADGVRPILLLKDEKGELTLPVALNPLEAGVALTQSNKNIAPVTPHRVTQILMQGLNLSFESCVFTEIKGAYQYVRLNILGSPDLKFIKVRADEAMSFCLHFNVPLYASKSYIAKSKILTSELQTQVQKTLAQPEALIRSHNYVM